MAGTHADGQAQLWSGQDLGDARDQRDHARARWQQVRQRHAVGSAEEAWAWQAYREASDRLWSLMRDRPL